MTKTELPGGPEGPGDSPGRGAAAQERTAQEKALGRVAGWWPKGLDRTDPEPEAVTFTRETVRAWGPPNPAEASQALASCYQYSAWRHGHGLDLDAETAFGLEEVLAYVDGPLADSPRSSRKSVRMYLRRLDPSRDAAAITQERVEARWGEGAGRTLDDEALEELIASYSPQRLDPARFERVAPLVRDAVRAFNPTSRDRARNAMLWGSQLAAWADNDARPLRNDVVFHPDTVEEYIEGSLASGVEERTVATEAALLRGMAKVLNPTLRPNRRVVIGRAAAAMPYSTEEIDAMVAMARRQKTEVRRRYSLSLIALGLCAGPFGGEYSRFSPSDVVVDGDVVCLNLQRIIDGSSRRRSVVALPEYAHLLLEGVALAAEARDAYLLGGEGVTNRVSSIMSDIGNEKWSVPIDTGRLRATYLVGLGRQHHLAGFLEQAGLTSFSTLDLRVLPFLEPADALPAHVPADDLDDDGDDPADDHLDHHDHDQHGPDDHPHHDDDGHHHDDDVRPPGRPPAVCRPTGDAERREQAS